MGVGRENAFTYLLCQELLAKPKIRENNVAFGVKQHILQLQVSVDDAQLAGTTGALRTPPITPPAPTAHVPAPGHCSEEGGPLEKGLFRGGVGLGWD